MDNSEMKKTSMMMVVVVVVMMMMTAMIRRFEAEKMKMKSPLMVPCVRSWTPHLRLIGCSQDIFASCEQIIAVPVM
eukprot:64852-Hanusia_phi.AAC.1